MREQTRTLIRMLVLAGLLLACIAGGWVAGHDAGLKEGSETTINSVQTQQEDLAIEKGYGRRTSDGEFHWKDPHTIAFEYLSTTEAPEWKTEKIPDVIVKPIEVPPFLQEAPPKLPPKIEPPAEKLETIPRIEVPEKPNLDILTPTKKTLIG